MAKAKVSESRSPEEHEENQSRMSFGEHLEELRKRVIRAAVGSIAGIAFSLYFIKEIVLIITHPYLVVMQNAGYPDFFSVNKPAEVVMNYLTLSVQVGLILTSPWIIYQVWAFVAAGLYAKERKIVYRYVAPSALLFFLGVAFFYFIVLPLTLSFFVRFTEETAPSGAVTPTPMEVLLLPKPKVPFPTGPEIPEGPALLPQNMLKIPLVRSDPPPPTDETSLIVFNIKESKLKAISKYNSVTLMTTKQGSLFANFPRLEDYLKFVMFTSLIFGLAFEMPMVIIVLAQVDIVRPRTFREIRKYAYFTIIVLSAIAAPTTDPTTMFFLAVPMILLYELGIIAASIITRGRDDEIED